MLRKTYFQFLFSWIVLKIKIKKFDTVDQMTVWIYGLLLVCHYAMFTLIFRFSFVRNYLKLKLKKKNYN